jgi:hypothetical protein
MLNRVALDRAHNYIDVIVDFVPEALDDWPDLVQVSVESASTRVRLRLHPDELEVLAVALDNAVTGGDGELFFKPDHVVG